MRRLSTRVEKLEADSSAAGLPLRVAVVESPFPAGDPQEWAGGIVEEVGCSAVWVIEGLERRVLLPATDTNDLQAMPYNSEAERLWKSGWDTYPHFLILGKPGALLVERFNSKAHERARIAELEQECVR